MNMQYGIHIRSALILLALSLEGSSLPLRFHAKKVVKQASDPEFLLQGCLGIECAERYVSFKDGAYAWKRHGRPQPGGSFGARWTAHTLGLSSQSWMSKETGVSAWTHQLDVVVPEGLTAGSAGAGLAVLLVNEAGPLAKEFAARTGLVTAALSDTPPNFLQMNPLLPVPVHEEAAKALSWKKFANEPNEPWPIELPTLKAVVRAMDAVAEFSQNLTAGAAQLPAVTSFVVAGWSKRAIAALMAAEIDPRVRAIIPISHAVDLDVQGRKSYMNIGETVDAAKVYDMTGVYKISGDRLKHLEAIIDPVYHLDRLTMPKLFMMCGGDDFFAPDATRSWWHNLPSPSTFYMFGNSGHAGFIEPFKDVAVAFLSGLVHQKALPTIEWTIDDITGDIAVRQVSNHTPLSVRVWSANSKTAKRRDFRHARYDENHDMIEQQGSNDHSWIVHAEPPKDGSWKAFFAEFTYRALVPGDPDFRVTTEVSVIPNTRPFSLSPKMKNYIS